MEIRNNSKTAPLHRPAAAVRDRVEAVTEEEGPEADASCWCVARLVVWWGCWQ